jgi:hypothetical protein
LGEYAAVIRAAIIEARPAGFTAGVMALTCPKLTKPASLLTEPRRSVLEKGGGAVRQDDSSESHEHFPILTPL